MTCREASNLLPLFFDGELDARQMRAVALHSSRCGGCEGELRNLERLQELVSEKITTDLEEIDFTTLWPAVERQLGPIRTPWWPRLRAWWIDGDHQWLVRLPVFAAAAAIAVLALLIFTRAQQPTTQPDAPQVAAVDNAASIESVDADSDSVAVLSDPQTRTTVLWVSEDSPTGRDVP
jgi:hypothetical protein